MTDQPTPPLHEQVRTLEADLVMCREQLAQETERADTAEQTADNLRGRAIADEVRINNLIVERDEWYERAESYRLDVAAIRDALDAPEDADINQLIDVVHAPSTRSPSRWRRRTASRSLNPQQRTEPTQMPEWHEDMVAKP